MKKLLPVLFLSAALLTTPALNAADQTAGESGKKEEKLSLITKDADEGFQLAIKLSRKGVTETQPDREVLFDKREEYAKDPDSLIAASQVIAIHFQTIAIANNFWKQDQ